MAKVEKIIPKPPIEYVITLSEDEAKGLMIIVRSSTVLAHGLSHRLAVTLERQLKEVGIN